MDTDQIAIFPTEPKLIFLIGYTKITQINIAFFPMSFHHYSVFPIPEERRLWYSSVKQPFPHKSTHLWYSIIFSRSSLELLSTSTNLQTVNVNTFLQSHLTVLLVYCILWFSKLGLKKTTFGNGSFPGGLYLMGFILKMAFGNINYTQNTFKVTTILLKYALSWNIVFEKWNGICEHFLIL